MPRPIRTLCFAIVAMTLSAAVRPAEAAYCALRDPVNEIYLSFPEADAYRSILRTVDADAREEVAARLPFTLHFNELAKHTLYVAIRKDRPVGLVHVRSEKGKWGLVELAWSFDLDLKIRGFRFQRCRDMNRTELQEEAFMSQLVGKGLAQLRPMLSEDGTALNTDNVTVPEGCDVLALTVLRSAMKTIVVTDIVWSQDLKVLRALAHREDDTTDSTRDSDGAHD